MEKKYLNYLKVYTHLKENKLVFCFVDGKIVTLAECEKFFNELFIKFNKNITIPRTNTMFILH